MIDLYFAPTPNTWKASIMLEECDLAYRLCPVDLLAGDQFSERFLAISPNNKLPAIVDHDASVTLFESGAILVYLAEKTGRFLPRTEPQRSRVMQWLFWQVGGLGPTSGQWHHFRRDDPSGNGPARLRFDTEISRLYAVFDRQLARSEWIAEAYSVADMACWGWVWFNGAIPDDCPNVLRWFQAMADRPAVQRGKAAGLSAMEPDLRSQFMQPWYGFANE